MMQDIVTYLYVVHYMIKALCMEQSQYCAKECRVYIMSYLWCSNAAEMLPELWHPDVMHCF